MTFFLRLFLTAMLFLVPVPVFAEKEYKPSTVQKLWVILAQKTIAKMPEKYREMISSEEDIKDIDRVAMLEEQNQRLAVLASTEKSARFSSAVKLLEAQQKALAIHILVSEAQGLVKTYNSYEKAFDPNSYVDFAAIKRSHDLERILFERQLKKGIDNWLADFTKAEEELVKLVGPEALSILASSADEKAHVQN